MSQHNYAGPFRVYVLESEEGEWAVFGTYADFDQACDIAESLVTDNAEAKVRDVPTYVAVHHVAS